ncbi:MAG TPA: two-component regulator propeller domain-containing protein, partial [Bacteroidia bacterium]
MIFTSSLFPGKKNVSNAAWRCIFIFLLCFQFSFAQNFRNFSSLTGKRDVAVNCMVQGLDGDFWIGTAAGLVTYDGQNVKFFNKENGLVDDNVTALYITSDHTLWIGHKSGKITILKGGKFFSFSKNDKLTDEPVYAFAEGEGMWIATYGSGLFRFKDNELEPFNAEKGLSDDFVYTLYNDKRGHLWAGTDAGITRINLEKKISSFSVYAMKEGLPDNIVRQMAGDNNGDIWIAMQDSGLCRFDTKELHFIRVKIAENWRYGAISSLDFDTAGSLYVGTKKNGVVRYTINADGKEVLEVIDANSGLLSNEVNDVFTDREKNLWVATAKGLSEMRHSRLNFLNTKNGLLSDKVEAVMQDSRGDYWIATDKGTARYSFLPDGEVRVKNYFLTEGMLEEQVICMHEDQEGNLWFGTYGRGVYMLGPSSDKPVNFDKSKGLADNNVSAISSGKDGILWFATQGGGITRMDPAQNFAMKNYSSQNGLPDDYVFAVLSDSKGRLWVGMDGGGIALREAGSEQFVNISEKNNLKGKTVYSIKEDKRGNIWFSASASGIYKFDGSTYSNYSVKNGLRDNDPSILSPAYDELVLVHNKGIDVLNIADGSVKYFSISDNDVEPNLNAGFTDREGNVWIGTNSGTVRFRPYDVPADSITPMIHLDGLMVQFQPYPLDSTRDFSWRQNNFIFNFSSIWFRSDEKVKFRYKLVGSDSSYFETQNNTASYPSLPAGSYTFLVSAANNEGKW